MLRLIDQPRRINRPRSWRDFVALAGLCVWFLYFCPTASAVDPLPPDIEAASSEVQARYMERSGRESLEAKVKAGRERYEDRLATRQAIYRQMEVEVANRMGEVTGTSSMLKPRSPLISFVTPTAIVIGCAIAMIFVVQAWRRTALR